MTVLFDAKKAPLVERLARIEGQSNFLSLLSGVEAGPDTTQDMGALAFARARGAIPEFLEAHVAQSKLYRIPMMTLVFRAVCETRKPDEREAVWIRCAVSDAFLIFSAGKCKAGEVRAKQCKVQKAAYLAMRNLAHGVMTEFCYHAEREWGVAMRAGTALSTK